MGAAILRQYRRITASAWQNAWALLVVFITYAAAVTASNMAQGGDAVMSIIAGVSVAAIAFALVYYIVMPLLACCFALFDYFIDRQVNHR